MSIAIFAVGRESVQPDESEVRSTLDPYNADAPAAKLDEAPDYNETASYVDNANGTIRPHQVNGAFTPTQKYAPYQAQFATNQDYALLVNEQVASSGQAAAKELTGQQGHGTMSRTESMEPQIREGADFGADYFAANVLGANEPAGDYMTPQVGDAQMNAVASAFAARNAREAAQASLYGEWLGSMVGG